MMWRFKSVCKYHKLVLGNKWLLHQALIINKLDYRTLVWRSAIKTEHNYQLNMIQFGKSCFLFPFHVQVPLH